MRLKPKRGEIIDTGAGFTVEILGRTGLRYREGFRSVFVDSEILAGSAGIAVFAKSIRRWGFPFSVFIIGPTRRAHILENIRAAFRSRDINVEVA